MQVKINYEKDLNSALTFLFKKLTIPIRDKLICYLDENPFKCVNEIRFKASSYIILIADSRNIKTDIYVTQEDIVKIFHLLCDESIYAHINTIREGYISIGKGLRAGICGRAITERGNICEISDITSINIRIPNRIAFAGEYIFNLLKANSFQSSVLLYSAPGVGKTTILRDLIYRLSNNDIPIRHCVIDSREELTPCLSEKITSDVFLGYPKGQAIEFATRSMTPQIIICDEITSQEEADSVLLACNAGVKLIATTHASSYEELLSKEITKGLIRNCVFDYALGVKRNYGESKYNYILSPLNETS